MFQQLEKNLLSVEITDNSKRQNYVLSERLYVNLDVGQVSFHMCVYI